MKSQVKFRSPQNNVFWSQFVISWLLETWIGVTGATLYFVCFIFVYFFIFFKCIYLHLSCFAVKLQKGLVDYEYSPLYQHGGGGEFSFSRTVPLNWGFQEI